MMKRKKMVSLPAILIVIFTLALFALAGLRAYLWERESLALKDPLPVQSAPAHTPVVTAAPDDTAGNTPGPSPSAGFIETAVVVDGESIGVLASRQAAEELLLDILRHYAGLSAQGETVQIDFANDVRLVERLGAEITTNKDELLSIMIGPETPVRVERRVQTAREEFDPCKNETVHTPYLPEGYRIIISEGIDGVVRYVTETIYINDQKQSGEHTEKTVIVERVDGRMLLGTARPSSSEPGRNEGEKGKSAGDRTFIRPVSGPILLNFGPYAGGMSWGLDYEAAEGEPVKASCSGVVVCAMERGGYGLTLEIDHGEGFVTRYAHLREINVKLGDKIEQGQEIALAGKSGGLTQARLHFELRISSIAYNPRYYLDG